MTQIGVPFIGRRVARMKDLELPGDYTGPHMCVHHPGTPEETLVPHVWYLLPIHQLGAHRLEYEVSIGSGIHGCESPPWVFRECPDGSLEIRESIACGRGTPEGEYWHGYLDAGHSWRRV